MKIFYDYSKLMQKLFCLGLLLVSFITFAQPDEIIMVNGGSSVTCDATFFDPGGTGNYPGTNGAVYVHTICSPTGDPIYAYFTSFSLFANSCFWGASVDELRIYDGNSTSAPLIGTYERGDLYGVEITGTSGCLTFRFKTEDKGGIGCASNNGMPGWSAAISCEPINSPIPSGVNCSDLRPFCSDGNYAFPNITSGSAHSGPDYGCLGTQPNPVWYYFQIDQPGTIEILIKQSKYNGSSIDVDFAMWGPYNDLTIGCNDINSGTSPLQCSYSTSGTEYIGIGTPGGYGPGESTPDPAQTGEYYIVVLTNYDGSSGFITLEQIGGTASTNCAILVPNCNVSINNLDVSACQGMDEYDVDIDIQVNNPPSAGDLILEDCAGNTHVVASAPFGTSYSYSLNNLTADGANCNISVYFSNDTDCEATQSYTSPEPCYCDEPTIYLSDIEFCSGNTADLNDAIDASSDPATITFHLTENDAINDVNAINSVVSTDNNGTYWVRAENITDPDCYLVYQINISMIVVSYTLDTSNDENCDQGNGSITISASGGLAPYTYSIDGGTTSQGNGIFTNLQGGTFNIHIEDANGCSVDGTESINNVPGVEITGITTTDATCNENNGVISFQTSGGANPIEFSLNGGTPQANPLFENLTPGTYSFVVVDLNGCDSTGTIIIDDISMVSIDNSSTINPTCAGDTDGSIELFISGGVAPITFEWTDGSGNIIGGNTNELTSVGAGNYSVTVTDANGCVVDDNFTLVDPSLADASFTLTDYCKENEAGNSATDIATPGGTFSIVSPIGDTASIDPITGEIFNGVSGTTYIVEYTTPGICPNTSTESITIFPTPDADFEVNPDTGMPPLEVEIINNSGNSGTTSTWEFGDGGFEINYNDTLYYAYTEVGQYTIVLTEESINGCVNSTSQLINVIYPEMEWEFPNVFTPNGDNQNDFFKIVGYVNVHEFEITVLNRWGNIVFNSDSIDFMWNGRIHNSGADCNEGTYFYKARLVSHNGDEENVHGFVQLARNK